MIDKADSCGELSTAVITGKASCICGLGCGDGLTCKTFPLAALLYCSDNTNFLKVLHPSEASFLPFRSVVAYVLLHYQGCSAECQCFSCPVYKFTYLLTYFVFICDPPLRSLILTICGGGRGEMTVGGPAMALEAVWRPPFQSEIWYGGTIPIWAVDLQENH